MMDGDQDAAGQIERRLRAYPKGIEGSSEVIQAVRKVQGILQGRGKAEHEARSLHDKLEAAHERRTEWVPLPLNCA